MIPTTDTSRSSPGQDPRFTTTHWSVVLAAGSADSPLARHALERLCQSYWYPLYAYVRSKGNSPQEAEDATQEFFCRLLQRNDLGQVRHQKAKFRSFLLTCVNNLLSSEWRTASALKRGGGKTIVSLDDSTLEDRYRLEPVDVMDPEKLFERRWAMTVLDRTWSRLRQIYGEAGKSVLYDKLKSSVADDEDAPPYAQIAAELHCSEDTIKSSVRRIRQRFRKLLREEVANTLNNPSRAQVDEELSYLISVVRR